MKYQKTIALVMALMIMSVSACSNGTQPATEPVTDPATTPPAEQTPTSVPPQADPVSDADMTLEATPVTLLERPQFDPDDAVGEAEMISPLGYTIGMTFAQAQALWEIPKAVVDYGISRWTAEYPSLCIYLGNMYYEYKPVPNADINDMDAYTLYHIYYGQTIYCTGPEQLPVLRDIKLGDSIADALNALPGNRTPRKWALDQLYGEYGQPGSASLEYITDLGFYDLRIYCENSFAILSFHSDGKLWIADVYANEG